MSKRSPKAAPNPPADASPEASPIREDWLGEINSLLRDLESVATAQRRLAPVVEQTTDNELAQVRLGVASSLFAALQCKHPATAGHALRVALTCSAWATRMELPTEERDRIEIAALLHDVGMIGAPDHVLAKPGALDDDEAALVGRARRKSVEILRHSCADHEVLRIVQNVGAWFNGSRRGYTVTGQGIPRGARMIAIAEAFDAMTTDHVYRPARAHERALAELFECAGTQFDPDLVRRFAEFHDGDQSAIHRDVAGRWLQSLDPQLVNSYWQLHCATHAADADVQSLFQIKLLDNMHDAVVFVDAAGRIALWNRGAERLTGIASSAGRHRLWQPEMLHMADERGRPIVSGDCPVAVAMRSGVQSLRRLTILSRNGRPVAVDTHAIPVVTEEGNHVGAILLFHDASSEISLEQRCQSLHEKATRDPLTQVANRAEFDRVHETFVAAHRQQRVPCSLIICDLDRFKAVNDNFGHQAGDEAIKSLAALLKASCRPGDLVARYGGEEFVVLCADCDNAAAARRAEQIRKALAVLPQPKLGERTITASFGVTEIQPGDTPETMLRRADRALLMAKNNGRNMVVQLGAGTLPQDLDDAGDLAAEHPAAARATDFLDQTLITPVPIRIAVEKLRGFVADHRARVVSVDGNHLRLEIEEQWANRARRVSDRPMTFALQLKLEEDRPRGEDGGVARTRIFVHIEPRKQRDRRRDGIELRTRDMLASLRSYLMATAEESAGERSALDRAKKILAPWLGRR